MIADKKRKILEDDICENSLLILIGKSEQVRNGDVLYSFRQDSDFLLLTGANIPDLRLMGVKREGKMIWTIFSDNISEKEILWGTNRLSHEELKELTGITEVRGTHEWDESIDIEAERVGSIYVREQDIPEITGKLSRYHAKYHSLTDTLKPLRMYKIPEEIEHIRRAIKITEEAFLAVHDLIRPGVYEYEIEAKFAHIFRSYHATESYPGIVASGSNSCIMHYDRHMRRLEPGDTVLMDCGAEWMGYSADVTRTFFVGEPSVRQRSIYESVKRVKAYGESLIGKVHSRSEHEQLSRDYLIEELLSLGLIDPALTKEERISSSKKYLAYRVLNHHLGLDTHDVGSRDDLIAPGMVLTCEPGIYIREESIGIRLEDDIFITEDGYENLSTDIPL